MAAQYKDYYATLGVSRKASDDEIKKSFRKLAREFHPDVAKNKKQAEEKFKEINEAYEVLGDASKRKRYDELGPNWNSGAGFQPPPGGNFGRRGAPGRGGPGADFEFGGTGFSDFFEQIFGSRRGGRGGFHTGAEEPDFGAERGRDIEGDILVTIEEAMKGSVRAVSVRHGRDCDACSGTGYRARHVCPVCQGKGQVSETETHQVKIPAGVIEGQKLRVAGRGETGVGGGQAGDLFLRVRFAKHPDFEVDGRNLIHELALAPWEAALGAEISVPTLNGPVSIRIPAGTQAGQKLRVKGRGLPEKGGVGGDLFVITRIEMPTHLEDSEREAWSRLAKLSTFDPRA